MANICIIDYQMGNLRSVQKAFERVGQTAVITSDPDTLLQADKIVLPGVGAFGDAMRELNARDLVSPIRECIAQGKPFLGICLGLQLLFDVGYEGGEHPGMGILPGRVVRFDVPGEFKVPHMGWNELDIHRVNPLLQSVPDKSHVYFVHSYHVVPDDERLVAATADYPDPFCAMVWSDNIMATQFHPEKSQSVGLKLLENFGKL